MLAAARRGDEAAVGVRAAGGGSEAGRTRRRSTAARKRRRRHGKERASASNTDGHCKAPQRERERARDWRLYRHAWRTRGGGAVSSFADTHATAQRLSELLFTPFWPAEHAHFSRNAPRARACAAASRLARSASWRSPCWTTLPRTRRGAPSARASARRCAASGAILASRAVSPATRPALALLPSVDPVSGAGLASPPPASSSSASARCCRGRPRS